MEGLILAYTALIANANVRMLLKSVVQDAQLETINFSESKQPILNVYALIRDENEKTIARTAIIGFLNQVMYMIYPNYIQKANTLDSIKIGRAHV